MEKSLLEYAYEYVSKQKKPVSFAKIWAYVVKESGISEEQAAAKISIFYTNLSLDGRFVSLANNEWDLKPRHTYDEAHDDLGDVYNELEEDTDSDEEEKEDEEYKEYNEVFEEPREEGEESLEKAGDSSETEEEESL